MSLRIPALLLALSLGAVSCRTPGAGESPMLAHNVYFTLLDDSPEAQAALVQACHRYLSAHSGVTFYAAGTRELDLSGEVNDTDFDVALHVVFANRAAHDRYQTAESHLAFIEENSANWESVRVFDSDVSR